MPHEALVAGATSESGFETKQAALDWANDQEARVRQQDWHDPRDGAALLADWIELWWAGQDIEPTRAPDHHPSEGVR
ncbi:hypothetical protein [Actinomadura craniellae]|nr:hypothetical protein [Actinomadura craniellae]